MLEDSIPYAGARNLGRQVKTFMERDYSAGKSDLYAAFILRCLESTRRAGWVGMVTQQSWMFQKSHQPLRDWVLDHSSVESIVQVGEHGFRDAGAAGAFTVLFALRARQPPDAHELVALRIVGPRSAAAKAEMILSSCATPDQSSWVRVRQSAVAAIPGRPLAFWLPTRILSWLAAEQRIRTLARVEEGYKTADNDRFLRCFWEILADGWVTYEKGGGYKRWAGSTPLVLDWREDGVHLRAHRGSAVPRPPRENPEGLTYSEIARGSLGFRILRPGSGFDFKAHAVFPREAALGSLLAVLNARLLSYMGRAVSPSIYINQGYVAALPISPLLPASASDVAMCCLQLTRLALNADSASRSFLRAGLEVSDYEQEAGIALLHALEGFNERLVFDAYELDEDDVQAVLDETGMPAGWHPLISRYDAVPESPEGVELPEGLAEFLDSLEHRELTSAELEALRDRVRTLYVAGPGAKEEELAPAGKEEEGQVLGAHIPIPTETFLEELSTKLQLHPISIFHLLEEMREQEGLVCPPEMRGALEDYVVVTVLRLLGYRWPEQDGHEAEHGPIIPAELVDSDGVIPLVACNDEPTLAQRVRARMELQFSEEGAEATLAEFRRYMGKDLGTWLTKEFFRTHTQRFKNRPIAWHLTSSEGTFQTLMLYHRLSRETLQRVSNLYAAGLINRLRGEEQLATERGDERVAQDLRFQIEDVDEFRDRLRAIEEGRELANRIRCRWKDEETDGRPGPYAPDIDDGVKVNIRPFQETGLLTRPVIKKW